MLVRLLFLVWAALALPLAVFAQPLAKPSTTKPIPLEKIVAKADAYILLKTELDLSVYQYVNQYKEANPKGAAPDVKAIRCKVLDQLVLQKILLAKADIDSVTVKDEEVAAELDERMNYMVQQVGGRDRLEAYYKKSVEQFKAELRKQVRDQLVARKMQAKITEDIKVTPAQVRRYFNAIPKDSIPFFSTEVEVAQIVRHFKAGRVRKAEAKAKAEDLRKRIVGGEDFEILAKAYSADPGSAQLGGKLLGATRGQMVPEYEAAAMQLKKGETSPVTESQFGFHIIQILDKRGNEYDSRHILIQPSASDEDREAAFQFLDSLAKAIRKDSITFDRAAQKYSDDQGTKNAGGYFTDPASGSTRVPTEAMDPKVFFVIDTMKIGGVSPPVSFSDEGKNGYRILYYKSKILPHEANLKDDYQRIQNGALGEAKRKATAIWIKKARQEVAVYIDPDYADCHILKELEN